MAESKVMLNNLPEGTMKSDIEKVFKEWVSTIKIIRIDLPGKRRGKKIAFVQLSTQEECLEILKYFDDHFTLEQGFPIEDGFGNFSLGVVKKFVPKSTNNEFSSQNNSNNSNIFQDINNISNTDDDTVSWLSGVEPDLPLLHKQQQQRSSQPTKIMLEEVAADTTKSEIENLMKTELWPEAKIMNIDLAHPRNKKDTLNAYITLEDQNQCDSFIKHFQTNFADGFWFVNNLGCNSKMTAKHYIGKKKQQQLQQQNSTKKTATKKKYPMLDFHLILKKIPPETASEEIHSILNKWLDDDHGVVETQRREKFLFVKLKSWLDCDTILQHFNEQFEPHGGFAFQNKKGHYDLVLVLRNEEYFLFTGGKDSGNIKTPTSLKTPSSANPPGKTSVSEKAPVSEKSPASVKAPGSEKALDNVKTHKKDITSDDTPSVSQPRGKKKFN